MSEKIKGFIAHAPICQKFAKMFKFSTQEKLPKNAFEQIYILNPNGTIKGLETRHKVHTDGILHATIQCWLVNEHNQVLIQRRSATKDMSAGKWDVSFGGHCSVSQAEDPILDNVIKEGKEEIGYEVEVEKLIKLGQIFYVSRGGTNKEMISIYLINVPDNQTFNFSDGEVSEVKWMGMEELKENLLHNPKEFTNRIGAYNLLENYFDQLRHCD